jgi:hypothetical protein
MYVYYPSLNLYLGMICIYVEQTVTTFGLPRYCISIIYDVANLSRKPVTPEVVIESWLEVSLRVCRSERMTSKGQT